MKERIQDSSATREASVVLLGCFSTAVSVGEKKGRVQ